MYRGKQFIRFFIIQFVFISAISICAAISILNLKYQNEKNALEKSAASILKSTSALITNYINKIDDYFTQNAIVLETIEGTDLPVGKSNYLSIKKVSNIISYQQAIQNSDETIENVSLYYKKQGLVVTKGTIYDKDSYRSKELLSFIDSIDSNTAWYTITNIPSKDYMGTVPVISYIRQIPLISSSKRTSIIADINLNKLSAMINKFVSISDTDDILLVDNLGMVIIDAKQKRIGKDMALYPYIQVTLNNESGREFVFFNNDKFLSTYEREKTSGWKIVVIRNANSILLSSALRGTGNAILQLMVLLVLASLVLSVVFYKPLAGMLCHFTTNKLGWFEDEYKFILQEYLSEQKGNSENLKQLERCLPLLKGRVMSELFMSDTTLQDFSADLPEILGLNIEITRYAVMALRFIKDDMLHAEWMRDLIAKVINEIASHSVVWFVDEYILCIVNLQNHTDDSSYQETLIYIAGRLESELQIAGQTAIPGISGICTEPAATRHASECAIKVCEYNIAFNEKILFYDNLMAHEFIYDQCAYEYEKKLKGSIKLVDFTGCQGVLQTINDNMKLRFPSLNEAKSFYKHLFLSILSLLFDYDIEIESVFPGRKLLPEFESSTSFSELQGWFLGICKDLCDYLNSIKTSQNANIMERLFEYIEANIDNPDMNLSTIAERMFFSVAYLSRIFKEETNMGFVDYVHLIRLERVKKLLLESNLSISEIANSVGMSVQTISRVFKQSENMTLGQFRSENHNLAK